VTINAGNVLTLDGPNGITVANGSAAQTVNTAITLGNIETWTNNSSNVLTLGGVINTNGYFVTMAGSGNIAITGNVSGAGGVGISGPGATTLGGVIGGAAAGSAVTVTNSGTLLETSGGAIANASTLSIYGGSVSLAGVNNYSGATTITGGAVNLTGSIIGSTITLNALSSIFDESSEGAIGGSGGFAMTSGSATLLGANYYTGATTIGVGTLKAGDLTSLGIGSAVSISAAGALDLNGSSLTIGSLATSTGIITDNSSGTGISTLTITGSVGAGNGTLIEDGATERVAVVVGNANSTTVLTNVNNTFSGGLYLTGDARITPSTATVSVGSPGDLVRGPYGTGVIYIGLNPADQATIYWSAGAPNSAAIQNAIVVNTSLGTDITYPFRVDGIGESISGSITANEANLNFGSDLANGAITLSGQLTSAANTTWGLQVGVGVDTTTVTLANTGAANDYAGDTIVTAKGILTLAAPAQIPNGVGFGNVNIASGGVLNLGGFSQTIDGLIGAGTVDGVSGTPTLTVGNNDATGALDTFTGVIKNTAGSLSLTKIGAGTLTLQGANTYTGVTTVAAGQLIVSGGGTIAGSTGLAVSGGAQFYYLPSTVGTMTLGSGATLSFGGNSTFGTAFGDTVAAPGLAMLAGPLNLNLSGAFTSGTTYTLLTAAGGFPTTSSFYNVVDPTNFTYTLTLAGNSVQITPTTATAFSAYYWLGGFAGGANIWAASNGLVSGGASNWASDSMGTATPLVPGAAANVIFSAAGAVGQGSMTLGSNMSVNSITVDGLTAPAETNALTLGNAGGYVLTIGSAASPGITVNAGSGAVTLSPYVVLGNAQTWTNNSSSLLSVGSAATSVANGSNLLTIAGAGTTTITNFNGGTGGLTVSAGTGTTTLAGETLLLGAQTWTNNSSKALTVTGTVDANANLLSIAGSGSAAIAAVITGSAGLEQNSTSTTTLSGSNNYAGVSIINQGTLAFTTTQDLPGGLTFGAAALSTTLGSLNLSTAGATFGGVLLVQTNSTTANTITIGSGQTLTLADGLTQGTNNALGVVTHANLTISGAGSLLITGGTVQIGVSQTTSASMTNNSSATLNLSGLTGAGQPFAFVSTAPAFNVGLGNDDQGTLILSNNGNSITAATLTVGNSNGNNAGASTNILTLGTGANIINADNIDIAFSKSSGTISWASSSAGPGTLVIENREDSGGANIVISSNNGTGTAAVDTGLLDLRGHESTVIANALSLGVGSNASTGGATGTLDFDTGTFTANTVIVGSKSLAAGTGAGAGIINLSGGSFTVNIGGSVVLATNTATTGTSTGLLNITGGVFTSNGDITKGGGTGTTATVTLAGGALDLTGHNIGSAATPIDLLNFQTGTLQNVSSINGTAGVNKSTTGTLTLAGVDTYVGATQITAGTIIASGSISGTSSVSVGSGGATAAALSVTGSINTPGAVTVGNAATLSGNGIITAASLTASSTSAANPAIVAPTSGNAAGLTVNNGPVTLSTNSTLQLSIANSNAGSLGAADLADYSKLTLGTGVSANITGSDIAVTVSGAVNVNDVFTIILNNGGSAVSGMFANATPVAGEPGIYGFTSNGQSYEINYAYSGPTTGSGFTQASFQADQGGTEVALLVVPEPNSWAMLLGSLGLALGLQRFRRRRPSKLVAEIHR
jgi:autotransporter-associated beta strand protein